MRLYFKKLTRLWEESLSCTDSDVNIFNKICDDYNFVSGVQTLSYGGFSSGLIDHVFIFKNKDGQNFIVVNPYLEPAEIMIVLEELELAEKATILGPGFWKTGTTAVLLPYEPTIDIIKYSYLKHMGEAEYDQRLTNIYNRMQKLYNA